MQQDLIKLYDTYTHGTMPRREFLKRLSKLAGGAAAAAMILSALENNYAHAAIVPEDTPGLEISDEIMMLSGDPLRVYVAQMSAGPAQKPTVLVIHENRGLNPHIEDVTRRLALEGFFACAVDMISLKAAMATPADPDEARKLIYELDTGKVVGALTEMVTILADDPRSNHNVGAVGFCWGGGMVNSLAAASPVLKAGVAYYGRQIDAESAARIKAALMLHYAGLDDRINQGVPAYERALGKAGVEHTIHIYEEVNHAFNNDTNGARYNKAAADLAWGRTVAFLKEKLA